MSIWKKFGDDRDEFFESEDDRELRLNHEEFDQWLDSINESGDPERDQEYYDKEEVKYLGEKLDKEADQMKQAEYPEMVINTPKYTMTISTN